MDYIHTISKIFPDNIEQSVIEYYLKEINNVVTLEELEKFSGLERQLSKISEETTPILFNSIIEKMNKINKAQLIAIKKLLNNKLIEPGTSIELISQLNLGLPNDVWSSLMESVFLRDYSCPEAMFIDFIDLLLDYIEQ